MRRRTVPRVPFVAALLVGLASASSAATSKEEVRRIDDHHYFVKELARGWEPLLADIDRTIESLAKAPPPEVRPIREIGDSVRETIAKARMAEGEKGEGRALELFERLAKEAVDESKRPGFDKNCADILMNRADRAEKAERDADALGLASRALAHVPAYSRAIETIGRLGFKVARASWDREDYDAALTQYDEALNALKTAGAKEDSPKIKEGRGYVDEIRRTTGTLSIAWLGDPKVLAAVKGPKTDFTHAAIGFAGTGRAPAPQTADRPRRMRAGAWRVTATGSGGGAPFSASVTIPPDKSGEIVLPTAIPDGMVIVPAVGSDDAFLIDRTEVSNEQLQQMTGRARPRNPRAAAEGVSFQEAEAAAKAAGKRLPTIEQWTHAAFGAPKAASPRYPWGDDEGQAGTHFVADSGEAQDVDSCPAGASKFSSCRNMAGNVWEWLADGWLIGGGYKYGKFSREVRPAAGSSVEVWTADLLRDRLPPPEVYDALSPQQRDYYYGYNAKETTLQQAGLRCVVPLGKPWR